MVDPQRRGGGGGGEVVEIKLKPKPLFSKMLVIFLVVHCLKIQLMEFALFVEFQEDTRKRNCI